ncbi:MAG: bacteriohemerythrin [Rhodospirillales bacterium]|nr:bacteriohemerythrin [Rhodospirillales bacterium]
MQWSKDFEVGIPFIDADHRLLVDLIKQANESINSRDESAILSSILGALFDYTEYHFFREEKMMELAGYQGLKNHREIHHSLANEVREIDKKFRADPEVFSAVEFRSFLNDWLIDHITGHDLDYRHDCLEKPDAIANAGSLRFMEDERAQGGDGDLKTISVMVVDDNKKILLLVETILRALGLRRIKVEQSSVSALDALINRPADLVLCDWVMDEMNGGEFALKVKEMKLPSKVIIMTGLSIETLRERSTNDAIHGYLEKPISAKSLLGVITLAAGN